MDLQTPGRALRLWLVELFALANLAFLSVDIYLAHSANSFDNRLEWIPIPFGLLALLLAPSLLAPRHVGWPRTLGFVVGGASVALGVLGLLMHLHSAFFIHQTIKSLVYAAPFIAPLSYVGVGMLLLLNRMEGNRSTWGAWVLILAAGGFLGNFVLSLLDHAQNGFFSDAEWIPVVAAAFGFAFLLLTIERPHDAPLRTACGGVMAVEFIVGSLGRGLHLAANLDRAESWYDRIIFGAPVFAPLLFSNLALLAAIGLWDAAKSSAAAAADRSETEFNASTSSA